jgi:diguanylate cyclase (GGDEF)-like protein
MIGCLVPALRNALQYLSAMQTATRDALTKVGNRVALEITADREIAMARRTGQPTAILVLDIDHFKSINDKYGHTAGDHVLIDVAQQLRENCREVDSIFRFGGEEFVVLLSQTEEIGATAIAERIRLAVANMNTQYQQQTIKITASIGIACLDRGEALPAWFERADRALYLAKKAGRNRVMRAAQRSIA